MTLQKPSVCPLDCPDTCSLAVTVADGEVLAVRGTKANPITHGAICAKVARYYPQFVHGPNRLRHPLERIGTKGEGRFRQTTWESALELIQRRVGAVIERYGPEAVLPLNYAGRHGARLVVIDPRRTQVAEQAHLVLPVRPGTDVVLAWAIATELERISGLDPEFIGRHVLGFEDFMRAARAYPPERAAQICGVGLDDVRTLARWYKESTPAVIAWGNGLERNRNGGSGLRAIAALPALAR